MCSSLTEQKQHVFPCRTVRSLFLCHARACSEKARNQTGRVLEMPLRVPVGGKSPTEGLFPPSLDTSPARGERCAPEGIAAGTVTVTSPRGWMAQQEQSGWAQPPCPARRVWSVCQCRSEERTGFALQRTCLERCEATPQLLRCSVSYPGSSCSQTACLTIPRQTICPQVSPHDLPNFNHFG